MKTHASAPLAAAFTVGVATALVLSGCTDGGDGPVTTSTTAVATTSTTTTTTVTPTTTPTPSSTGVPSAAKQRTKAGAEAFARFFLAQVNLAWTKPDDRLLGPLCLTTSQSCASFQKTAKQLKQKSQRYASAPISVGATKSAALTANGGIVEFTVVQNRVSVMNKDGSVAYTDEKKPADTEISLAWQRGVWHIALVKVQ